MLKEKQSIFFASLFVFLHEPVVLKLYQNKTTFTPSYEVLANKVDWIELRSMSTIPSTPKERNLR